MISYTVNLICLRGSEIVRDGLGWDGWDLRTSFGWLFDIVWYCLYLFKVTWGNSAGLSLDGRKRKVTKRIQACLRWRLFWGKLISWSLLACLAMRREFHVQTAVHLMWLSILARFTPYPDSKMLPYLCCIWMELQWLKFHDIWWSLGLFDSFGVHWYSLDFVHIKLLFDLICSRFFFNTSKQLKSSRNISKQLRKACTAEMGRMAGITCCNSKQQVSQVRQR